MGVKALLRTKQIIAAKTTTNFFKLSKLPKHERRFAGDTHGMLYNSLYALEHPSQRANVIRSKFRSFFLMIKKLRLYTVMILEGEAPIQKAETVNKRNADRKRKQDKIDTTQHELEQVMGKRQKLEEELQQQQQSSSSSSSDNGLFCVVSLDVNFYGEVEVEIRITNLFRELQVQQQTLQMQLKYDEKQLIKVLPEDVETVRLLMDEMNIPYIQAPHETDSMIASLYRTGQIYGAFTEDSDTIALGINMFSFSLNSVPNFGAKTQLDCYKHEDVLRELNMTAEQLLVYCFMIGNDYGTLQGMGPVYSYDAIQEHKTLEGIVESVHREYKAVQDEYTELLSTQAVALQKCQQRNGKKEPIKVTNLVQRQTKARLKFETETMVKAKAKVAEFDRFYEYFYRTLPLALEKELDGNYQVDFSTF